ncbi:hypothetical protein GTQ34_07625 [Muricauda sp. JGD-17]|uniref:DinB family protein n=1 Tax=Flagellimonas ochracea TaxID=2696472 RepID=A0A964TBF2_9FLAO|nr:hypothetical protein [Allomuricauda ochracea]NAY91782.1 hypothetical protein [Allomuricauda ochracea]
MSSLVVTPENQIQRLNSILVRVEHLQKLDFQTLTTPPGPKSWNIVEVLTHLNIAYGLYRPKFDEVLENTPNIQKESNTFKVSAWQRMIINMQRPKGTVRKWKMKTLKRFEPLLDTETMNEGKVTATFVHFFDSHLHLKDCILKSRRKDVSKRKISSAIGPIVKFYLPEAFEFLLCHLERHMVQIDEILKKQAVVS